MSSAVIVNLLQKYIYHVFNVDAGRKQSFKASGHEALSPADNESCNYCVCRPSVRLQGCAALQRHKLQLQTCFKNTFIMYFLCPQAVSEVARLQSALHRHQLVAGLRGDDDFQDHVADPVVLKALEVIKKTDDFRRQVHGCHQRTSALLSPAMLTLSRQNAGNRLI